MNICLKLHGLGVPPPEVDAAERRDWVEADVFARMVDLARRAPTPVRFTFDDGNLSDVSFALPILEAAGLRASFFFSTDFIGRPGYADEDDIRALAAAGMEIGSHGCRHASWLEMSGDEITEDVIRSFARLGAILSDRIAVVAPPYDDCDARVLHILHKLGIKRVYGGVPGHSLASDWLVRRNAVTADTPWQTIESWLTMSYTWLDWAVSSCGAVRRMGSGAWRRA